MGLPAESLDKYRPITELGRGGSAVVNLGVARGPAGFSKLVVLKSIREEYADASELIDMFLFEANISARMNHPNIVQTYEISERSGLPVLVMEYLDGQPLQSIRRYSLDAVDLKYYIEILVNVLHGLHYAHELTDFEGNRLNIVHRDVSPHNIFVTYEGSVKLIDFGIAKLTGQRANTATGVIKGKICYMAPEQIDSLDLDPRTDVFAAGIILWEAIASKSMWEGLGEASIMRRLMEGNIPDLATEAPDAPQILCDVVNKALAPAPEDRYRTAAEMAIALKGVQQELQLGVRGEELGAWVSFKFSKERQAAQQVIAEGLRQLQSAKGEDWSQIAQHFKRLRHDTSTGGQTPVAPLAPRRPKQLTTVAALAVAALGVGSWFLINGSRAASDSAAPAATVVAPAEPTPPEIVAPPPAPVRSSANLNIEVRPLQTKLFLDGKPLDSNPARVTLEIDDEEHVLRAELRGHDAHIERFVMRGDRDLALTLRPIQTQRATSRPTKKVAAPTPKASNKNCDPPWTIGPGGVKEYRRECLE